MTTHSTLRIPLQAATGRAIHRRRMSMLLIAGALASVSVPVMAAPVASGGLLPPLTVADQHERQVQIDSNTRVVVFAADKAASDIVNDALRPHPSVLAERRIVYIADISAMPAIVTRMFALPKLRELPFPVGLVRDAQATEHLPRKPKEITLVKLQDLRIQAIEFVPDAASLHRSLGISPP